MMKDSLAGNPSASVTELLQQIDDKLNEVLRWPELVTFEEMNIKGPGTLTRVLIRAAAES